MPKPQWGPQRSPIFGVLIPHGNVLGRDVYLGVSHAFHPTRARFQRFPILGFSCIYAHTL